MECMMYLMIELIKFQIIGDEEECSSEHWLAFESPNDQLVLLDWWTSLVLDQFVPQRLLFKYFFCLAREFWNQTWVTLFERPVRAAIRSKSWPSGFESSWKFACNTESCSSVNVVRTLFVFEVDLFVGVEPDSSLQTDTSCVSPFKLSNKSICLMCSYFLDFTFNI